MPESTTIAADTAAIDAIRDAHIAALNTGEVVAWTSLFTPDGVQMPPHFPANVGRESIQAWSQGFLGHFKVTFALDVAELKIAGDWAFERGAYRIEMSPKQGGEPMADSGKYITLYERQSEGNWAIARDLWNSDIPLPWQR